MFDELFKSYIECKKNKGGTINAIDFIIQKEKNFYTDLTKSPYNCIKGRGIHSCIDNVKKIYPNYNYYLQVDIKSFFMSIYKEILKCKVKKFLPKDKSEHINNKINFDLDVYNYLLDIILSHDCTKNCKYKGDPNLIKLLTYEKSLFNCKPGVGMPIGNYTSQFFANIYLHDLDKYIINLGFRDYFRYVDDLLIFGNDYKKLKALENTIDNYLKANLNMQLARQKTNLKQTSHGLDFLGYFIKPHSTYTRKRVKNNFIQKIELLQKDLITYFEYSGIKMKIISFESQKLLNLFSVFGSYIGHLKKANTKNLIKKIIFKFNFLQYYFDFEGSKLKHIKNSKFKTHYQAYKYYSKLYKKTIIFYPLGQYYIFTRFGPKTANYMSDIIIYPNIGFKINKRSKKLFLLDILLIIDYNIIVVDRFINKTYLSKLILNYTHHE